MTRPHRRLLAAGLLALAALAGAPAAAQDAKPQPTSCAGVAFEDPPGDQVLFRPLTAGPGFGTAPANLDVLRGFFRYVPGPTGANVLTANIEVSNLDKSVPSGANASAWYMRWTVGGDLQYASATVDTAGEVLYEYGHFEGTSIVADGETTGRLLEGEKGIVEIVVPVTAMGLTNQTLTDVFGQGRYVNAILVSTADRAPDADFGKNFKAVPCAEAGAPTTPGPVGEQPPATPPPPPGSEQPATLDVTVKAPRLSAKKLRRTRSAVFTLDARETITSLVARLYRGSVERPTVVGTARLARAEGTERLRFRFSRSAARKIKKGTYTLELSGRKADGRSATAAVRVTIRR